MQDGIIAGNGNSRYLKTVAAALSLYPTYEDFITALIAGTFPIDLNGINEAGWSQKGTPLNKFTLVSDTTETKIWGSAGNHTVDQVFGKILGSIGYYLIKEYTSPGNYTYTFDRQYTDVFVIVIGAGGGGAVGSMGKTGQQSGRGNGGGGGGGGEVIVAHFLNSNIIKSNNIIIGYGGDGGMAVGPNGGNEIVSGNKGLNGGSTTAFGLVALGGEGAPNEQPGRPGGNLDSNRTDTPGCGGVSTQRGNDGILVDIIGIHMAGGGGGGADGNATTNKERGASGGATGGGDGGDGASQSANGTDGKNGSKGGGGGGAGGGCNYSSNQKRSGIGGRGGNGYVAIYARGIS